MRLKRTCVSLIWVIDVDVTICRHVRHRSAETFKTKGKKVYYRLGCCRSQKHDTTQHHANMCPSNSASQLLPVLIQLREHVGPSFPGGEGMRASQPVCAAVSTTDDVARILERAIAVHQIANRPPIVADHGVQNAQRLFVVQVGLLAAALRWVALAIRAGVSNLMARNAISEAPTYVELVRLAVALMRPRCENACGANAGTANGFGHVLRSATPPFGLHVGASWSLRLLEDEQMGVPGQGPTPALPSFISVDCCPSFLIFQVARSVLLHQHSTPFLRSVREVDSVHSFTLFASPSQIHFPQKSGRPFFESTLVASEHQLLPIVGSISHQSVEGTR